MFIFIFHCRTLEISIKQFSFADNSVSKRFQSKRFLSNRFLSKIFLLKKYLWKIFFSKISFWKIFFWKIFLAKRFFWEEIFLNRVFLQRNLYNKFLNIFLQVDQGVIWRTMMDWESLAAVAEKVDEGQIPTTKQAVYVRQRSSIVFYQAKQDWKLIALHAWLCIKRIVY